MVYTSHDNALVHGCNPVMPHRLVPEHLGWLFINHKVQLKANHERKA